MQVLTGCPGDCGGSCPLLAYVEEGRVVRLSPEEWSDEEERPQLRPCAFGLAQAQRTQHPDRLLHPLKRIGARGEGAFRRISWDEALDEVSGEMLRIKEQYGPRAVMAMGGSGNNQGVLRTASILTRRFLNAFGGHVATRGSISNQATVFASRHSFGMTLPPPGRESLLRSKLVIMWGVNPSDSIQGTDMSWYLAQAKEAGTRFVFVDPRLANSAAALADEWIPIRPGTDTAMLVAMAHVLIREELCDLDFLARCTYGYDAYRDYCRGTGDGVPKTPEWAERICGVPAEQIAELARAYVTEKPANLWPGYAPGRTAYGEQFTHACIALAAMSGNVGISGGGAGCYAGPNARAELGVATVDPLPNPVAKSVVGWRWADALLDGEDEGRPSEIKMVLSVAGNRLNQCGDIHKGIRALNRAEYVVVLDQFLTPTARYADLVLPVTTQFEQEDVQLSQGKHPYLFHSGKVMEPLGEARTDLEILRELARRMGLDTFAPDADGVWLSRLMQGASVDLPTIRERGVYWAPEPEEEPLWDFCRDPLAHPLPTPSGKIEIYSQTLAKLDLPQTLPPIPTYVDSWEGLEHPLSRRFPLLLVTWHSGRRTHSMGANVPLLRELEPHTVWLNAQDAEQRGITDGEMVEVFNELGATRLQAKVTKRLMPGVVGIYQGTWFELGRDGRDRAGSVNILCKDTISPGEAAATNAILVQVGRLEA